METALSSERRWPELAFADWRESRQTLHRWLQIVGKVRLSKSPWMNHGWQTPLYLTARGLTTSLVHDGARSFSIDFDFVDHALEVVESHGGKMRMPLLPESVASFYTRFFSCLGKLGIEAEIDQYPNELPDRTPFSKDHAHASYEPEAVRRFWQAMLRAERVMQIFRSKFLGKASPVHFFWGSMDLAVTRFSGRRAPEHPGGVPNLPDLITREAYSHEVSSCGFWPGNDQVPYAAFYSYAYPKPEKFEVAPVRPAAAFYHQGMREFLLPYDAVREAASPEAALLDFFESTYEAAANLGRWDRRALEEDSYLHRLQVLHPIKDLQGEASCA